jgi:hypothetical protein
MQPGHVYLASHGVALVDIRVRASIFNSMVLGLGTS